MKVPIQCEQCGHTHLSYTFMALYDVNLGATKISHELDCDYCSFHCKLKATAPLLLTRTDNGVNCEPLGSK